MTFPNALLELFSMLNLFRLVLVCFQQCNKWTNLLNLTHVVRLIRFNQSCWNICLKRQNRHFKSIRFLAKSGVDENLFQQQTSWWWFLHEKVRKTWIINHSKESQICTSLLSCKTFFFSPMESQSTNFLLFVWFPTGRDTDKKTPAVSSCITNLLIRFVFKGLNVTFLCGTCASK